MSVLKPPTPASILIHTLPICAGLAFALSATAAPAATLDVVVRAPEGHPLASVFVSLSKGPSSRFSRNSPTDAQGRARFMNLPPGSYDVGFLRLPDSLLDPRVTPFASPPAVTIRENDERLEIEYSLVRGVPVEVTAELNGDPDQVGQVHFRHRASGMALTARFRDVGSYPLAQRLLAPGVWDVSVDARSGLLLIGIDHDGTPLPGHVVTLDLAAEPVPTYLTWHFVAPCVVEGSVSATGGVPWQARIEATLVEPGTWIEAARVRGGSKFETVAAGVGRDRSYSMLLPDGRWRVAPAGEPLASSEPPFVDVDLVPGDSRRLDFHVTFGDDTAEDRSDSVLMVHVDREYEDPRERFDGTPGTRVEVYPAGGGELLADEKVHTTWARIMGLEKGDYEVAALHPDFLEARTSVRDFAADRRTPGHARVRLERGAELHFDAVDTALEPLAGVEFVVERTSEDPELLTRSEDFLEAKRRRRGTTDATGRTRMTGFYPGVYRVRAGIHGQDGDVALIDLVLGEDGEPRGPEIEIGLDAAETLEIRARQRPAARLRTTLVCSDGWALSEAATVWIYDVFTFAEAAVVEAPPGEDDENALVTFRNVALGGPLRDTLSVGPVPQGIYKIAVQPAGFERPTWAFETFEAYRASEVQVTIEGGDGQPTIDIGAFHLECGPAVDVVPRAAEGVRLPEVHQLEATARLFDLQQNKEIPARLALTPRDRRIEIRNLPRGRMRLEFTLSHPHFLPTARTTWEAEVDLERGSYVEVEPLFERIGGAIRVEDREAIAWIWTGEEPWLAAERDDDASWFRSLVPGVYEVLLCADPGCDPPLRRWPQVSVEASRTVVLRTED